jgi:maleamate amidohydrolase
MSAVNEVEVYRKQGFGVSSGFGKRPALLIVDFVKGFCDPEQYGGGNILPAVARTKVLLTAVRERGCPVAHTRIVYADDASDAGSFCLKVPGLEKFTEEAPAGQIIDELTPAAGEYVVRKTQPSAFFGTGLAAWLVGKGVDTVIVAGITTSGCVRASVVDAMSYNFRTIVATDGVGDRALGPHAANLFDMGQKYADLLSCDEIIARLGEP